MKTYRSWDRGGPKPENSPKRKKQTKFKKQKKQVGTWVHEYKYHGGLTKSEGANTKEISG